ncbi:MAG: phosphate signaling complex protein PhoU [Anaerolineales bacterium]
MPSKLRAAYDQAFNGIQEDILRLSEMVDQAIARSLHSLEQRDQVMAKQVIADDDAINNLRFKIEEDCLKLIATQQPAARDLRAIVAAMNIVVDVERMGDYAAGIAKTVIRMGDEPLLKPLIDIPRMVALSRQMLRDAIEAYATRNAEKARQIASRDDEVDHLYKAIFDELVEIMAETPASAPRATYLLWVAHNLERMGDRVTNIAERVVFINTGDMKELND